MVDMNSELSTQPVITFIQVNPLLPSVQQNRFCGFSLNVGLVLDCPFFIIKSTVPKMRYICNYMKISHPE